MAKLAPGTPVFFRLKSPRNTIAGNGDANLSPSSRGSGDTAAWTCWAPRARAWIHWGREQGWAPNIVQGKAEGDEVRASRLLGEIQFDAMQVPRVCQRNPLSRTEKVYIPSQCAGPVIRPAAWSYR